MQLWSRLVLFLLITASLNVWADAVYRFPLSLDQAFYTLNPVMEVLTERADLKQAMENTDWKPFNQVSASFFFRGNPVWVRFSLENPVRQSQQWLLKVSDPNLNTLHLFVFNHKTGHEYSILGGAYQPFQNRLLAHRNLLFPINLSGQDSIEIYALLNGQRDPGLTFELWQKESFQHEDHNQMLLLGLVLGVMLLTCLLLGLMSLFTQECRLYVLFGYCLAILFFFLGRQGIGFEYFWGESLKWNEKSAPFFASGAFALGLPMLHELAGKERSKRFKRYLLGVVMGVLALTLGLFVLPAVVSDNIALLALPCFAMIGLFWLGRAIFWQGFATSLVAAGFVSLLAGALMTDFGFMWGLGAGSVNSFAQSSVQAVTLLAHVLLMALGVGLDVKRTLVKKLEKKLVAMERAHTREIIEHHIIYQAMYDPLTGGLNRLALEYKLKNLIQEAPEKEITLILIHLSRFKEVNNTLGHHNGDEFLKQVFHRLNGAVSQIPGVVNLEIRKNRKVLLAALEGVVFGIVLHDVDKNVVIAAGEQIQECLSRPFEFQRMTLDISGFIGVARYPDHGSNVDEILQHAYVAIEVAQENNQSVLHYSQELDPYSARRLTLVGELKQALVSGGLEVFYQPQIDLKHNVVVGAEALVRWEHRQHGFVPPSEFIPLAEKTGVIRPLTAWVMDTALKQLAEFYNKGLTLRISVNLSAKNLHEPDLSRHIFALLRKYNLPPEVLACEITETAIMLDPSQSMHTLLSLHDYGIRLCIDDFGTGYSSLSYLKQLPVSEIKIDRSFVGDMCQNVDDQVIVNTTLNMSHNLGMEVVAEGVEDEQTLTALKRLGCDLVQGYYISKPVRGREFENWLNGTSYKVLTFSDLVNVTEHKKRHGGLH